MKIQNFQNLGASTKAVLKEKGVHLENNNLSVYLKNRKRTAN